MNHPFRFSLSAAVLVMTLAGTFVSPASGQSSRAASLGSKQDGYRYLNQLREAAGMTPLKRNASLERSAGNHAKYLAFNNAAGHVQRRGARGFSGVNPWDRALAARYPHQKVSENVSSGSESVRDSIDGLMTAIYHRLGFLAFDIDEVGLGFTRGRKDGGRFAYNMGNSLIGGLCASPPREALFKPPGSYVEICAKKTRIALEYMEELTATVPKRNPRVVLWPPHRAEGATPVFYEESPDPLPDYHVSGNPLSIQFNPALVKQVRLRSFRLFRYGGRDKPGLDKQGPVVGGRLTSRNLVEVKRTRLFTAKSDPHKMITPLEFVLFPLDRMEWDQVYAAVARLEVDGKSEEIAWHFRTEAPGAPMYRIAGKGEVLPVRKGQPYAIYIKPTRSRPTLVPYRYSYAGKAAPKVTIRDRNTLLLSYVAPPCSEAVFSIPGGGKFTVRLASEDNVSRVHPPEVLYAGCGEYGADFKIAGKGETLDILSGKSYRIHIQPRGKESTIGDLRYQYPQGVKVEAKGEAGNILRVKVRGKPCQEISMRLSGGRSFQLRLTAPGSGRGKCR